MPLLQQIRLENLLSFGPETGALELRSLNVLIGPNGAGKSNLIEMLSLLQACTKHLGDWFRESGGISNFRRRGNELGKCSIEVISEDQFFGVKVTHSLEISRFGNNLIVDSERVLVQGDLVEGESKDEALLTSDGKMLRHDQSVLSQRKDPDKYLGMTVINELYSGFRVYRDWSFGRFTPPRLPQRTDGRTDYLESDCSNLGMILNRIRRDPVQKAQLLECLNDLYPDIRDVDVSIEGGSVQVFLVEGTHAIPATRLSDGTLRYLCLLAILLHPTPPPLICIEEPELGLHPDVMPAMARLLKQASERTQLIVTTHSEVLVDALGDTPEDVVVCEKHAGCTTFNRLDGEQLKVWLKDYSLGNLWRSGQIGGNRW